jgi:putative ABC transport system substrate-binding protein
VVTGFSQDPVRAGLVDSFARPGGNVTGLYAHYLDLDGKLLQILKELLPGAFQVAVFRGAGFGNPPSELQRAGQSLRVELEFTEVRGPGDLEPAFKGAKRMRAHAVMLLAAPVFYVDRAHAARLAHEARLRTISTFNQFVEEGGLISYGADLFDNWKRTAYYVDRLLTGAKPADLPIEQVSRLKLAVNLKTAKAIGITIPESILLRADEVIR